MRCMASVPQPAAPSGGDEQGGSRPGHSRDPGETPRAAVREGAPPGTRPPRPPEQPTYLISGMINRATMLATLIIGLIAGPAVSLNGSPTVSPVTEAAWASEPLPP